MSIKLHASRIVDPRPGDQYFTRWQIMATLPNGETRTYDRVVVIGAGVNFVALPDTGPAPHCFAEPLPSSVVVATRSGFAFIVDCDNGQEQYEREASDILAAVDGGAATLVADPAQLTFTPNASTVVALPSSSDGVAEYLDTHEVCTRCNGSGVIGYTDGAAIACGECKGGTVNVG